jgi:hypothetical protein
VPSAAMTSLILTMVLLIASGCSKQSITPQRMVSAEKYFLCILLSLFKLAAPTTRPIQSSTPAMSDQHAEILEASMVVRRFLRRVVVLLGAGAGGGGK